MTVSKDSTDPGADLSSPTVLHRLVLRWYSRHGRALPWRESTDPYLILVSELMLQQTQAARVVEHLPRWLARFPDIASLARSSRRDVLLAWSGMGYNRRALYLHAAAKSICSDHGGSIPSDPAILRTLPGLGRYTSHAVACFGYRQRLPVVDVNIRRVFSRLLRNMQNESSMMAESEAWTIAEALLPPRAFYNWNQALMDLGAMICTARNPACERCPLALHCASAHSLLPTAKRKYIAVQDAAPSGAERSPAAVRDIPRRIYRGRLVEFLRSRKGHCATASELHDFLYSNRDGDQVTHLFDIISTLEKDGMISVSRKGRVSIAGLDSAAPLGDLLICLGE